MELEFAGRFLVWIISILVPAVVLHLHLHRRKTISRQRLPPGPRGWPVFGNMFDLGEMPHKTLMGLKRQYGSVVWLRLGSINTVVVLTAKAAAELFKNHDVAFADRTITEVMTAQSYEKGSLALAPYGTYWRVMKRIMTVEMLVTKRINETVPVRRKCADVLLTWIENETTVGGSSVAVARFVFLSLFNMLGNLILSRDLVDPESRIGSEFFTAMMGLMEWGGHPNIVDVFPCLRWLDPQGLKRKMNRDLGNTYEIVSGFLKERMKEREAEGAESRKKDFLEVLLNFEGNGKDEPQTLSEHELIIIIMEIFLAGSETTSSSIEWAMTELLLKPETMDKAKAELAQVVGPNRKFEESDIDNCKYLQAIIKETLRLHPPIPFLVPRKAIHDTEFMGYHIPQNTQLFINVCAIGRDPECWGNPSSFRPERFLNLKTEYKGHHFELIPFGAGRRICAGIPLAHRMLHLVLGSLLHAFDWGIDRDFDDDIRDTRERMGVTVRKLKPLRAIARKSQLN
ncbi:cytochrome P450 76A1-like [Ipomoea triloba]|uniref:cytochrome P450 76A1-like n=1 Tax=Ipomoea triloba TaxID=35885 RepID=UPI00125DB628|nr:cytochrome P450 76A1-like [Ipomoea triloba]